MKIPDEIVDRLARAQKVTVLTGAGISAESGIKTFRDPDGLWSKLNPEELASMDGFLANPDHVWEWYQERYDVLKNSQPNPGHYALAEMEKMYPEFALVTQNIDRLHQRAGSKKVYELHGNMEENYCQRCKKPYFGETKLPDGKVPRCPECGGYIRPAVVWFGENLPEEALYAAERAAQRCEVCLSVGTSGAVYPAAGIPIIAKRSGAYVIEVNPRETELTHYMDVLLKGPSGEILPELVKLIKEKRK